MYTYQITSLYLENLSMDIHTLSDLELEWTGLVIQTESCCDEYTLAGLVEDDINNEIRKSGYPYVRVERASFTLNNVEAPELELIAAL